MHGSGRRRLRRRGRVEKNPLSVAIVGARRVSAPSLCLLRLFPSATPLNPPLYEKRGRSGVRRGVADGKGRSRRGRGRARGHRCARGHCPWRRRPGPTHRWTPLRMGSPGPSGRRHRRPGVNAAARGVVAPSVTSVRPVHTFCPVHPVRLAADAGGPAGGRPGGSKRWPARIFHPSSRTPSVPKWRNDAIPRSHRSRRTPESHAPVTFFRPADAPVREHVT